MRMEIPKHVLVLFKKILRNKKEKDMEYQNIEKPISWQNIANQAKTTFLNNISHENAPNLDRYDHRLRHLQQRISMKRTAQRLSKQDYDIKQPFADTLINAGYEAVMKAEKSQD